MNSEFDKPLGQSARPASVGAFRRSFTAARLGAALVVLGVAGLSAFVSLQDRGLRRPAEVVVATAAPEQKATAPVGTDPKPVGAISTRSQMPNGAAIIKVNPQPDMPAGDGKGGIVVRDPSSIGQDLRVAHLPDRDLIEQSGTGPLPAVGADGRRPFDVYARAWSGARGARVAIVIGGLGLSQTGTQSAISKLPPEVTLAFSPQGNSLDRWMQSARRSGHELIMQIPLEPFDFPTVNPGRNTLTVEAGADKNIESLRASLSRMTNYTGVMNYMGARFVADPAAMEPVMAELAQRGLLYLDDGTSARTAAPDLAVKDRVPFAASDATIDGERDRGAILKKLDELERTARAKGFALGTGSAFDVTVDAVTQWVSEARRRGIEIVPVSAVAIDPQKS